MTPVVAECPIHGPFESRMFRIRRSTNIELAGNFEPCPTCQTRSRVMEGVFDFDAAGLATVLLAPSWSVAALQAVQRPIKRASTLLGSEGLSQADLERIVRTTIKQVRQEDAELAAQIAKDLKSQPLPKIRNYLEGLADLLDRMETFYKAGSYATITATWVVAQMAQIWPS